MSTSVKIVKDKKLTVGICRQGQSLVGVVLESSEDSCRLLYSEVVDASEKSWDDFAQQIREHCKKYGEEFDVVLGYPSDNLMFSKIDVPSVDEQQAMSMVRMQAVSRFPLDSGDLCVAIRSNGFRNGMANYTIAGGRQVLLKSFVPIIDSVGADETILDCDGYASLVRNLGRRLDSQAVIIVAEKLVVKLIVLEAGQVCNVLVLEHDVNSDEFNKFVFMQDFEAGLDYLGVSKKSPLLICQGENKVPEELDGEFEGLSLKVERIDLGKLIYNGIDVSGEVDCSVLSLVVGLCVASQDRSCKKLNIFEDIYSLERDIADKKSAAPIALMSLCAIILALVYVGVCFMSDKSKSSELASVLDNPEVQAVIAKQKLRKSVAQERPDMLDLFKIIQDSKPGGVMIGSFSFRKGQPVTLTAQSQSRELGYSFNENLSKDKNLSDVKLLNPTFDDKKKLAKYNISFHYKEFTKKKKAL